jgi:hypothetical protein
MQPSTRLSHSPAVHDSIAMWALTWLRLEGLALLAAALLAWHWWPAAPGWGLFAAAFLLPDLAMLGYLAGPAVGARLYNATHTTTPPLLLLTVGLMGAHTTALAAALIWLAHIGFDRALGYGLKSTSAFGITHLGRVGRPAK